MSDEPRQNAPSYTYEQAGVSIEAGNALVKAIGPLVKATMRGADGEIGGFGGFFDQRRDTRIRCWWRAMTVSAPS